MYPFRDDRFVANLIQKLGENEYKKLVKMKVSVSFVRDSGVAVSPHPPIQFVCELHFVGAVIRRIFPSHIVKQLKHIHL